MFTEYDDRHKMMTIPHMTFRSGKLKMNFLILIIQAKTWHKSKRTNVTMYRFFNFFMNCSMRKVKTMIEII